MNQSGDRCLSADRGCQPWPVVAKRMLTVSCQDGILTVSVSLASVLNVVFFWAFWLWISWSF